MPKVRISFVVIFVFAVYAITMLISCYSPTEGCLDPESTNYSITGDNDCEDCCKYPVFKLSIFHESKDTTFKLGDLITNDLGHSVSVVDFVYLLSDFKITSVDDSFEVIDSISLNVIDGVELVKDDVIRVTRDVFNYDVGTIIFDGNTSELSFKVGLNELINENRFTTDIDNHPLTNDPDSLFQSDSGTYVLQRIKLAQFHNFLDTLVYDINTTVEVSFPLVFESIRGSDKTIIIEAQYDQWFEGIDFGFSTKVDVEKAIIENTSKVFRQKE